MGIQTLLKETEMESPEKSEEKQARMVSWKTVENVPRNKSSAVKLC